MTETPTARPADEELALHAEIYRLLARLLHQAPNGELLDWLGELQAEDDGPLGRAWEGLAEAARQAQPAALERAHFRHLIGVIQGEVVPYASWYRQGELMDEALVALRRDLKRLGIARHTENADPEDHLAALYECMAILTESRPETAPTFFERHLAPWAGDCLADLARVDTPFYARLAELGLAFMAHEQARLDEAAQVQAVRWANAGSHPSPHPQSEAKS
ncbi:TorD/DmsD family molecular chaperone [Halomonas sp. 328]|uniref:TorD/DmsD family molecular chaperone n=1 Tax=Halomonas sp. 328 TaxID=2776704 RepID=UPI0018A774F9|nr:molecular chaperone TorD family protein [Halomonas sp. 328]MBF8221592.1 molecular chaperone TorD family protein [Halomonas sp. 328]